MPMGLNIKLIAVIVATLVFLGEAYAQERSIGTSWSFSGIGLTYEQPMRQSGTFLHIAVQLEMSEAFLGRTTKPGGSVNFTCNDILHSVTSRNGNSISFFAGAGAAAGYNKDCRIKRDNETFYGYFFGLKGRAGLRIEYDRKINITAAVAPVLGMHLSVKGETVMMRYYRYGLLQTLMPELTISYRF